MVIKTKRKRAPNRYYKLKNKIRIHGITKSGRYGIIGYKNIEDLADSGLEKGQYRIVEYVFYYKPTRKEQLPSSHRNFEVRVRQPEGMNIHEVKEIADRKLAELTNDAMVETAQQTTIEGIDFIRYSNDSKSRWMVMDLERKQFKYPKGRQWGLIDE